MSENDGGPAFPHVAPEFYAWYENGMSLRDAIALSVSGDLLAFELYDAQDIVQRRCNANKTPYTGMPRGFYEGALRNAAIFAHAYADAMLAERAKPHITESEEQAP